MSHSLKEDDLWPWAHRHTHMSWRNHYNKHKDDINYWVTNYQRRYRIGSNRAPDPSLWETLGEMEMSEEGDIPDLVWNLAGPLSKASRQASDGY